jgi:protein SCO1/2
MGSSRTKLLLLGASVISLGIILGTLLWLKLAPKSGAQDWQAQQLEGLTHYSSVPEFSLIERSGHGVGLKDLRGKIWIADFIYTTCTDTCPLQSAELAKLQEQLGDRKDLKLVSFTVDPDRDTPQILSGYAERFHADADRWLFLTGSKEQISRLIQEGFRLSATPALNGGAAGDVILHSPRFVLVDKQAQIRGYYDSRDAAALKRLRQDITKLLNG